MSNSSARLWACALTSSSGFPFGKPGHQGVVGKPPERVMATPLKGKSHKGNPPLPPPCQGVRSKPPQLLHPATSVPLLSGGKKIKAPSDRWGASPFYTPLTRGGVGGVTAPQDFLGSPDKGTFVSKGLSRVCRRSAVNKYRERCGTSLSPGIPPTSPRRISRRSTRRHNAGGR